MFRFGNIIWLAALLGVVVLVALFIIGERARRRRLARFGNPHVLLMPEVSPRRAKIRFSLFATAIALIIIALARPQIGSKLQATDRRGVEIVFVIDVSNSMLAQDFAPSRLEQTKQAVGRIIEGLTEERMGIVIFAGDAYIQLPITADHTTARNFVGQISPDMVSRQGTAIGTAINLAASSFTSTSGDSRVVVLITDGENHEDDAIAAARHAAELGIRIYVVGIGTPEGAPIQIGSEFIKDEKGDMVVSKLDEAVLQQIALATGGAYARAERGNIGLGDIITRINQTRQAELRQTTFEQYNELFPYPLGAALLFLIVEFIVLARRNRLLAHIKLFK